MVKKNYVCFIVVLIHIEVFSVLQPLRWKQ